MIAQPIITRFSAKHASIPFANTCILLQRRKLSCDSFSLLTKSSSNLILKSSNCPSSRSGLVRSFHLSSKSRSSSTSNPSSNATSTATATATRSTSTSSLHPLPLPLYQGPLASTFRRLKLFSLSSFLLATALTPVLLLAPAELGMPARIGLAITALATSGSSFALIAWISKPYVSEMRLRNSYLSSVKEGNDGKGPKVDDRLKKAVLKDPFSLQSEQFKLDSSKTNRDGNDKILECLQLNSLAVPLITTIYQPNFLTSTTRPFTTWTLSKVPPIRSLPSSKSTSTNGNGNGDSFELLIAETRHAKSGELKGRYIAKWSNDAKTKDQKDGNWKSEGVCYEQGKVQKDFNVHEELLGDEWKVLG